MLFETSQREPDVSMEEEDICPNFGFRLHWPLGESGSRREILDFPEMVVRLVG